MSASKLKEEWLSLLKEDLIFYGKVKDAGILDGLSEEQVKALKTLSEEDPMKDVDSFVEFKNATEQWRTN